MRTLNQETIDQYPVENGFRLRGMDMTRVEVFVDAAFAFAVTMLVVSFDQIPRSYEEMVIAIKGIPAFIVSVAQLVWIWHAHNTWSRRFGLEDAATVVLSTALLIVVLIYIYPLRVMAQGMFSWMSGGYLPSGFSLGSVHDLRGMFVFMGIGFFALCSLFVLMYRYAVRRKNELLLSAAECRHSVTLQLTWFSCGATGLLTCLLALSLPDPIVPLSGFGFALMGVSIPLIFARRKQAESEAFEN